MRRQVPPLKGHAYHAKTDAALLYIIRDAGEAAIAMRGVDLKAECKYLDQVNDANTVLAYRRREGITVREPVRLRHGHVGIFDRHCDQCIENGS